MKRRDPWPAWLFAVASSFAILEYLAVGRRRFPPLTSALQRILGIHPRAPRDVASLLVLGAAWTWVVVHLVRDVETKS